MSSELSTSRYTANYDGKAGLYALSKPDSAVAWTANVAATITGRPVVAEEAVLVPTDDGVRCVDPPTGASEGYIRTWERAVLQSRTWSTR